MEDIILVGYGGHAKSVVDCIERQGKYRIIGYTEVCAVTSKYSYLGQDSILVDYYKEGIKNVAICLGYLGKGNTRERIYDMVKGIGFNVPVIADPSSIVSSSAEIGEGTFIGKCAIVNAEARIGRMCIINTRSLIEHECQIGDFVHIAVGAVICGQVSIANKVFIGANTTIIQGKQVAYGEVIPAGITVR